MSRGERAIVRITAGLSLLLMLGLPAGVVAWIFTGDWRWGLAGFVSLLTGFAVGWLVTQGGKAARRG